MYFHVVFLIETRVKGVKRIMYISSGWKNIFFFVFRSKLTFLRKKMTNYRDIFKMPKPRRRCKTKLLMFSIGVTYLRALLDGVVNCLSSPLIWYKFQYNIFISNISSLLHNWMVIFFIHTYTLTNDYGLKTACHYGLISFECVERFENNHDIEMTRRIDRGKTVCTKAR